MKILKLFLGMLVLTAMLSSCATKDTSNAGNESAAPEVKKLVVYYSLTGNAKFVAEQIQSLTGADVFEIQLVEPYPAEFDATLERANREREANTLPPLAGSVNNIADYDVVFIGTPNWFGTLSLPVLSFLNSHDLSGKTVVPFITFGRGGFQNTITDIKSLLPNATILEEFGASRDDVKNSQADISQWLEKIGMAK